MTEDAPWADLHAELDRWTAAGLTARFWLRDDDACTVTPALDGLLERCVAQDAPLLLAVIPMKADTSLRRRLEASRDVTVGVHGIWHRNNAPPGRKAEELAPELGLKRIVAEVSTARARLIDVLGGPCLWYVPPWNRIAPEVASALEGVGFEAISVFGPERLRLPRPLQEINTHVDIIDWKGGRRGRPAAWVSSELTRQLERARLDGGRPVGVLTHHVDHDRTCWEVLDAIFAIIRQHSSARWCAPDDLLKSPA